MAARETLVILRLPWGTKHSRFPSKKAARAYAHEFVKAIPASCFKLEVIEDGDGDFVVREALRPGQG